MAFILEKDGKLGLNENILKILEKSNNPRLLLFYGGTRQGKSTTLNQIISGNIESWKYINTSPFKSKTSQKSLTVGCDIYGPIKSSEILKRHSLELKLKEDFDIFFCDTEGLFSLNGISRFLIPGILTLLQVCTLSVIMINTVPDVNTISQITSEMQFSKILQQINKDLISPLIAIYISGYQVDIVEYDDFDTCLEIYGNERDQTVDLILENINEKYKNLKISKRDFKVIPGGPYESNNEKEPNHKDLKARLYWNSINEIAKHFIIHANRTPSYNAKKLVSLIRVVFDIFKDFTELPENLDLKDMLIKFLINSFNEYSSLQFKKIDEKIKNSLKKDYNIYYQMLTDNNAAKKKLSECIEENKFEIYKTLIPDKLNNFMENATLKLRKSIEAQFEIEFKNTNNLIMSDKFIKHNIDNIIKEINKANFKEDINMKIVNNYLNIWKKIDKEYDSLFKYFKEKKYTNIENLKNNFNNKINKILQDLISKKIVWKSFFDEKKNEINKEINKQYLELYKNIQYQEDFNKLIKPSEILSKEIIKKFDDKYFKKLPNEKKDEIIKWINQACENEYNILKKDISKKQKWENIIKNIDNQIKEKAENYIKNIFKGKIFRNEINPNDGRLDVVSNDIKKNLNLNQDFSPEKVNEINNIIIRYINLTVEAFNKRRENLPLFEEFIIKMEQLCNKIADKKIKELLSKFVYQEDKIIFNEDNFYSFIKQNKEINVNIPLNNNEIDYMIRKVCQNKSEEYNNILINKKPKWSRIKNEIMQRISNECDKFIKNVVEDKTYKEEIKFDIKILEKQINSLDFLKGIEENKHNEILDLINKMVNETKQKILFQQNSLSNWQIIKNIKINEGKEIMTLKSESDLKTLDLKEIINILIYEVKVYPKFCDALKNQDHFNEVFNELQKNAEIIANKYINKKIIEQKAKKESEEKLNEIKKIAEDEKKKRIEFEKKMKNELLPIRKDEKDKRRKDEELSNLKRMEKLYENHIKRLNEFEKKIRNNEKEELIKLKKKADDEKSKRIQLEKGMENHIKRINELEKKIRNNENEELINLKKIADDEKKKRIQLEKEIKKQRPSIKNGVYIIYPCHCGNKVLDVCDASKEDNARIILFDFHVGENQKFEIIYDINNRGYTIKNIYSNKYFCANPEDIYLIQKSKNGSSNQLWNIIEKGNHYKIQSKFSGNYIDVNCGSTENGAEIILWKEFDKLEQEFILNPIKIYDSV